ncbi:hypothetical protein [Xenorhabdus taiwanensis]|uniref:hypothetical protein n=1 Tax=Xenorhabdus taiwanensis TaxID=3085177 RepID=UPI0035A6C6B3
MNSFVRAMMLSAPYFLITTTVYHYLGITQAMAGTAAVFSSVFANSIPIQTEQTTSMKYCYKNVAQQSTAAVGIGGRVINRKLSRRVTSDVLRVIY